MRYITISFKGDKIGSAKTIMLDGVTHYINPAEKQEDSLYKTKQLQADQWKLERKQKRADILSWAALGVSAAVFILALIK